MSKSSIYLNVIHDLGLKECLSSIVHDLVAELGLGDVLPQLLDASSLGWGTVLVNDLNDEKSIRAIQIIRDTLGGGGRGSTKCHVNFFCFLNSDFEALFRSKKSSLS